MGEDFLYCFFGEKLNKSREQKDARAHALLGCIILQLVTVLHAQTEGLKFVSNISHSEQTPKVTGVKNTSFPWIFECNENNKCQLELNSNKNIIEEGTFQTDELFKIYAQNSTYISIDEFQNLLENLGILKDDQEYSSDEGTMENESGQVNYTQSQFRCIQGVGDFHLSEDQISISDFLLMMPRLVRHLQSPQCSVPQDYYNYKYEEKNQDDHDRDKDHEDDHDRDKDHEDDHDEENQDDHDRDKDHEDDHDEENQDDHDHDEHDLEPKRKDSKLVWGITLFSVAVISLLSVIGILIVPLMGRTQFFNNLLSFLVSLAVGTLIGDALLHLLPHALGEEEHDHAHDEGNEKEKRNILISLVAVFGIYFFFLFESGMAIFRNHKRKKNARLQMMAVEEKSATSSSPSNNLLNKQITSGGSFPGSSEAGLSSKRDEEICRVNDSGVMSSDSSNGKLISNSSLSSLKSYANDSSDAIIPSFTVKINPNKDDDKNPGPKADLNQLDDDIHNLHDLHHDDHHHHHGDIAKAQGIKDLAWMIVAGDGMHNFSDGLAIGAAFTSSLSAGLSTSLAIFCHELPHELGDFAILIDSGMTIRKAILYNGLCACLAFFGAIIGLLIGEYTGSVKLWILAITAGGFLYVGLVDMLPQMLRQCVEKEGKSRFLFQNIGLLLGIMIMVLIAWFENAFSKIFDSFLND